jgi:hypothetical protein
MPTVPRRPDSGSSEANRVHQVLAIDCDVLDTRRWRWTWWEGAGQFGLASDCRRMLYFRYEYAERHGLRGTAETLCSCTALHRDNADAVQKTGLLRVYEYKLSKQEHRLGGASGIVVYHSRRNNSRKCVWFDDSRISDCADLMIVRG